MHKYCSNCSQQLDYRAKYCTHCGAMQSESMILEMLEEERLRKLRKIKRAVRVLLFGILAVFFINVFRNVYAEMAPISIEEAKESVVMINTYGSDGYPLAQGSGFCFIEDDIIITNYHVIEGANRIEFTNNQNETYDIVETIDYKVGDDLAVLRAETELKPLRLGDPSILKADDPLTTISSPNGRFNEDSPASLIELDTNYIAFKGSIQAGSSGGVLLNKDGKVVGIVTGMDEENGDIAYAINVDVLKEIIRENDIGHLAAPQRTIREGIGIGEFISGLWPRPNNQ